MTNKVEGAFHAKCLYTFGESSIDCAHSYTTHLFVARDVQPPSSHHTHTIVSPLNLNSIPRPVRERVPRVRRVYVRHMWDWIWNNFRPQLGDTTRKKARKVSKTGACGENACFLAPKNGDNGEAFDSCPFQVRCTRFKTRRFKIT